MAQTARRLPAQQQIASDPITSVTPLETSLYGGVDISTLGDCSTGARLLSIHEVALWLDVDRETVRDYIRQGLPVTPLADGMVRIAESDLREWVELREAVSQMVKQSTPRVSSPLFSFMIHSPEFAEGARSAAELFAQTQYSPLSYLTDGDVLQFITTYLTPFHRYSLVNAGGFFGWLQAAQQFFTGAILKFEHPEFQKAFRVGMQDYLDGSIEDLDGDAALTSYLAQQLSPQFDAQLRGMTEIPAEMQRTAGYVTGVVLAILQTLPVVERLSSPCSAGQAEQADQAQAPIVPIIPQKQDQRPGKAHLFEGLLPYLHNGSLPMDIIIEQATGVTFAQFDDFSQGYLDGCDAAFSDLDEAEGKKLLPTARDLWIFLKREYGPRVLAREEEIDQANGWSPIPMGFRAGFLAGYLHTVFAPADHSQQTK